MSRSSRSSVIGRESLIVTVASAGVALEAARWRRGDAGAPFNREQADEAARRTKAEEDRKRYERYMNM